MFEWLEQEISAVKTCRFHVVDGPADAKLREAIVGTNFPMPSAYKEFVLKFGNAKLYRNARNDSYKMGVFAGPREAVLENGTPVYHIGFHDGASAYMKGLSKSDAFQIFEFDSGLEEKVASGFEEWLSTRCATARSKYGKAKWADILRGPKPFDEKEKEIIEARRLMCWRVLEINADGDHIFEITNAGQRVLTALTIGVRSKDGRLNGAVRLNVANVSPGQTAQLQASCYKNLVPPQEIEIFALPEPKPEDRDYYWELKESA